MKLEHLLFEVTDKVAILTVNRPDVRNALNSDCWREIGLCVDEVERRDDIALLIVTGAGEKAFVAGADVRSVRERGMVDVLEGLAANVLKKLESCSKPTIAAVNGYAFGGGCEFAMACDIRVASENASFGLPELNLGILPGAGGTQRLAKLVGLGRAKDIILTGRVIKAAEALAMGLVTYMVPLEQLMDEAKRVGGEILKKGPFAVRLTKQLITASMSTDAETGRLLELFAYGMCMATDDKIIGIDAFLNKEKAEFTGR